MITIILAGGLGKRMKSYLLYNHFNVIYGLQFYPHGFVRDIRVLY